MNQTITLFQIALIMTARYGHFDCMSLLVEGGALVNARDNYGQTTLQWAAWKSHIDNLSGVLQRDSEDMIDGLVGYAWFKTIIWAAEDVVMEPMFFLIRSGADIAICDFGAETVLERCNVRSRQLLLDYTSALWHDTPLHKACYESDHEGFRRLLDEIDINVAGRDNWTVLHFAVYLNKIELVKFLLDADFEDNRPDIFRVSAEHCYSVLHIACNKGYIKILRLVMSALPRVTPTTSLPPYYGGWSSPT